MNETLDEDEPVASFADMDDLLDQWRQYVNHELQSFKIIKSDLFGSGCVCDLKTIFEEGNTSPDYIMELIPRVKDCYTQCANLEYNRVLEMFLQAFVNIRGERMTVIDLGEDEPTFYRVFIEVANKRAVFNTWDLWTTKKSRSS